MKYQLQVRYGFLIFGPLLQLLQRIPDSYPAPTGTPFLPGLEVILSMTRILCFLLEWCEKNISTFRPNSTNFIHDSHQVWRV